MAHIVIFTHPLYINEASDQIAFYHFMIHIVTLNKLQFEVHLVFMGYPCIYYIFLCALLFYSLFLFSSDMPK